MAMAQMAFPSTLSPGQAHDMPAGRKLPKNPGQQHHKSALLMAKRVKGTERASWLPAWGTLVVLSLTPCVTLGVCLGDV